LIQMRIVGEECFLTYRIRDKHDLKLPDHRPG
jgi:hypothetical protein